MKLFALMVALLWPGAALAQSELPAAMDILLSKGQVKIFQFDEPISRVNVVGKGIVETEPLTDRQLSIVGISPGETRVVVSSQNGRMILNAGVTVNPESGHVVKIYGLTDKNADLNAGYTFTFCHEFGCGRPDYDLPKPTQIIVERVSGPSARR
jgi:hypothetical protein